MGSSSVVSSNDDAFKSVVKVESGVSGGRRMSSSSGPPLDDQGQLGSTPLESYFLYMYMKVKCAEKTRQTAVWAGWPSSVLCMPIVALRQPRLIPSKP